MEYKIQHLTSVIDAISIHILMVLKYHMQNSISWVREDYEPFRKFMNFLESLFSPNYVLNPYQELSQVDQLKFISHVIHVEYLRLNRRIWKGWLEWFFKGFFRHNLSQKYFVRAEPINLGRILKLSSETL